MESYQAIYDAVRSRITGADLGDIFERAIRQGMDVSHQAACVAQEFSIAAYEMARPSVLYRPVLSLDGDHWCALYGVNIQEGVAGFGKSPKEAMDAFDKAWGEVLK